MSSTSMCVYCEELREDVRAHAERVMRCPLCKTETGITSSGAKFRLVEGEPAPEPVKKHRLTGFLTAAWRHMFVKTPTDGAQVAHGK